jgi:3-deoxy-D-manno-octulosonic-acid transferase
VFAHRDFLPLDEPTPMAAMLEALGPACVVFSRGDLWPELVAQTAARGIPIAVLGGTVRPASARLRWPARAALADMHRNVTWLGAATLGDAERWRRLGVAADRIAVTGDPRHDAILERVPSLEPSRLVRAWAGQAPVLVAGSIEPSDDTVLAEALGPLARSVPELRSVIVPHDTGTDRITRLRAALDSQGIAAGTWTGPPERLPDGRVTIVEAFGLLADLYLAAAVAYVGGGFARRRLHATIEPAAWGVPVVVGPRWRDAADAGALLATGAALALPAANAARALAGIVARLGRDGEERSSRGLAARATLATGASRVTADAILGLLNR